MSTNHTPNYQLSQWKPEDKVLMDDFNADNATIDTALGKKLERSQLLGRFVIAEEDCKAVEFDLSDLDWNEWEYLSVTYDTGASEAAQASWTYLYVQINRGDIVAYGRDTNGYVINEIQKHCHIFFFPRHNENQRINAAYFGMQSGASFSHSPFRDMKQLNISSNNNFLKGTIIELWGTR